jgi:hypothetical protein
VTVQNGSGNISGNNNMILNTPPTTGQPKGDAIPFSDQEVHGRLQPGNEPTPPNACSGSPGAEPMKVLIGGNAFVKDGFGKLTALKVGTCEALSMERTPQGISVNADLYHQSGQFAARIRNNEITALNGETFTTRLTRDSNTLTVKDSRGVELLYVRYINPLTLRMRGIFGCPGHQPVPVNDNGIPGGFMTGNCMANPVVAIKIK